MWRVCVVATSQVIHSLARCSEPHLPIHAAAERFLIVPEAVIAGQREGRSRRKRQVQRRVHRLLLELHVDEATLAKRRAAWKAPAPRYTRGVQAKFAHNASSASKGAVLDDFCA